MKASVRHALKELSEATQSLTEAARSGCPDGVARAVERRWAAVRLLETVARDDSLDPASRQELAAHRRQIDEAADRARDELRCMAERFRDQLDDQKATSRAARGYADRAESPTIERRA